MAHLTTAFSDDLDILVQQKLCHNPLILGIIQAIQRIEAFKSLAREYYFEVLLSLHPCPECGSRMRMIGQSQCSCTCGIVLDPTTQFQRSPCCGAALARRVCHYACTVCGQVVASKFLFDERLFDTEYFRTKMAESRENARIRREEIKNLLAASRSQPLIFENSQELDSVPGLVMALDEFIGSTEIHHVSDYAPPVEFRIEEYREAILTALADYSLRFTAFSPLSGDLRKDRIWRFITLIHMEHNGEVELIQEGNDILVRRHEADREGQAVC